ncbi:CopD family protein [Undibacterium sp. Jales W-56]|uniref:copper resistance D family protein n=1 Tax=Undibacterium sp. Jales W-56 TaxID=2897325 RepID=UPI0021D2C088|nr:CopD family protein [Undibacterium sp. Jales W-56]MCU6435270.1 CopD family protein [Undibacterium sp. Jales W-56]
MGGDIQTAITVATVLLNLAMAVAVGATMASLWLATGSSNWSSRRLRYLRPVRLGAIALALVALGLLLLLVSASMAEVPVTEAGEATRAMLTGSHFGLAWAIGMAALIAAALLAALPARAFPLTASAVAALAVVFYTRSMVSHASANGDFNLTMAADWIHLCLISVWVGEVAIAGMLTLRPTAALQQDDRGEIAAYIENLSTSATVALAGIVATGAYSAWHNLGSLDGLSGNRYGTVLSVKVAMVVVAVMLGGFNRFVAMPPLLAGLRGNSATMDPWRTFTLVLRVEAVLLLGVLVAAALLSATSPPTAA